MRVRSVRWARWGLLLAGAALSALAGAAVLSRSDNTEPAALPALIDVTPAGVRQLVVEAGGRRAELSRSGAFWSADPATPPQSAPLLLGAERQLFPLLAYRMLDADAADPQYGLDDPAALVRLHDQTGRQVAVRFGAASFSGAGFYAGQDDHPQRVFLVPRNTVDLLRSLTTGQRATSADPLGDKAGRFRAEREEVERDNEMPVYLRQVLDTGGEMPPPGP